jgi:hypothetical protein
MGTIEFLFVGMRGRLNSKKGDTTLFWRRSSGENPFLWVIFYFEVENGNI